MEMGEGGERRKAYMVLSPRSWSYAEVCLRSLLQNCAEDLELRLLTDSAEDAAELRVWMKTLAPEARHTWEVLQANDLLEREKERFAGLANLRAFRQGHPCWRKITDPLLLAEAGEEMVVLDPDLYFPNRFRFERTPDGGLLLMWQEPNCLLPEAMVRRVMEAGVPLARHVDIGVAQWRMADGGDLLGWLDGLIGTLGGKPADAAEREVGLPRIMHVEAIVWSALAMRCGGGHMDPTEWVCWRRSQMKRLRRRMGATGKAILRSEAWETMRCFHGGGEAKWWIREMAGELEQALDRGCVDRSEAPAGRVVPFVRLSPWRFGTERFLRNVARWMGYYNLLGAN